MSEYAELVKRASAATDIIASLPTSMALGAAPALARGLGDTDAAETAAVLANAGSLGLGVGGTVHGAISPTGKKDLRDMDKNRTIAMVPGVTGSRMVRRRRAVSQELGGSGASWAHETLGAPIANALLMGTAGAGLGGGTAALVGGRSLDGAIGAAGGAAAGAGVSVGAQLVGALLAALTKRRTLAEQQAAEKGSKWSQYLIPGKATYDYFKALGVSNTLGDTENQKQVDKELSSLNRKK